MGARSVAELLSQVEGDSDVQFDLLVMRLAIGADFPNIGRVDEVILSKTDTDTVLRVAERIEYYKSLGPLLINYPDWPQPILKAVITELILHLRDGARLSIVPVLERYTRLQSSLEIEPEAFINCLNGWEGYAQEEITVENFSNHITDHELIEHAAQVECGLSHHLIETASEWLTSLSIKEWQSALRNDSSFIYKVTCHLLAADKLKPIPDNVITVYRELLIEVAMGGFEMSESASWSIFYEKIHKGKLKAAAKNIRDLFISEISITPDRFLSLSDLLINHASLDQRNGEVARRILEPVVGNEDCMACIVNNSQIFIPIINGAEDDAEGFKDAVRQKLEMSQDDDKLIRFAKEIGISADDSE
ncbi:MAG: hypothetical protein OXC38_05990 [Gammaproteobacteria bacterium]|nr:hypothetical protein [Gammaproteobacteria bacterium]